MTESPTSVRLQDSLIEPVRVIDKASGRMVTIARGDFSPKRHMRAQTKAAAQGEPAGTEPPVGTSVPLVDPFAGFDLGEELLAKIQAAGYRDPSRLLAVSPRKLSQDAGIRLLEARRVLRAVAKAARAEAQTENGEEPQGS